MLAVVGLSRVFFWCLVGAGGGAGGGWVRVRRRSSVKSSVNSHWCAKQLEAEQSGRCMQIPAALARIPHIHMFNASSPHFAIPLSLRIRLSQIPSCHCRIEQVHLPSHYTFLPFVPPPIHRHAPHSQRPAHCHLKHPRHQSIPCHHSPASSARVPGLPA